MIANAKHMSRLAGPPVLELRDVSVVLDGFSLKIDSFCVRQNELKVIVGGNGAGKTTLCDVISGKTKVTTGHVYFNGREVTQKAECEIAERGVGRKFQTPTVYDSLTAYENMELALPRRAGVLQNLFRGTSRDERHRIGTELDRMRLSGDALTPARFLSHGKRQWLELAMLAVAGPQLLLVDEPAAGLTTEEVQETASLLNHLRASHAIIVIEHNMDFVRSLNAEVTYLHKGRILTSGPYEQVWANPKVRCAYWGERAN